MQERSMTTMSSALIRRSPKKRWVLAVLAWTMLGSVFIYLQYKLDYRVGAYGSGSNQQLQPHQQQQLLQQQQQTINIFRRTTTILSGNVTVPSTGKILEHEKVRSRTINSISGDQQEKGQQQERRQFRQIRQQPKQLWQQEPQQERTRREQLKQQQQQQPETPYLPADVLPLERSKRGFNNSCAVLPTLFDIKINNVYWQHMVTEDGTNFYLYGAYYDNRSLTEGQAQVRILGMTDRIPPPPTLCHFWYNDTSKPSFSSNETTYHYIWHPKRGNSKNGTLQPVLLNCPLPTGRPENYNRHPDAVPVVVSLVQRICDNATNALKVLFNKRVVSNDSRARSKNATSTKIAVCVKGLNYLEEDRSVRLIEWLELLQIVGVDRVFMYELSIHPNMSKVLAHYQRQGFVDVRPLTLPGDQINEPHLRALYLAKRIIHKRQNELIPYNDCLYRNLQRYNYVALLDIDEIIMPTSPNATTWQQLIAAADLIPAHNKSTDARDQRRAALCAQHVYFFDNATNSNSDVGGNYPPYLHMLSHVRRARNFTKPWQYVKCLHDTRHVITLHNHFPIACGGLGENYKCPIVTMDVRHGRLHHYRKGCTIGLEDVCAKTFMSDTVVDKTVLKYGNELASRSENTLKKLGFLK